MQGYPALERMYEFLERLIRSLFPVFVTSVALALSHLMVAETLRWAYTEQIIFPEIDYDKVDALRGMDITITTTARTDDEGRALLRAFNFPLKGLRGFIHG